MVEVLDIISLANGEFAFDEEAYRANGDPGGSDEGPRPQ